MNKFLSIFFTLILSASALTAATVDDSVAVHFKLSSITLYPDYKDNSKNIDALLQRLRTDSVNLNTAGGVESISIVGGASPEGPARFNRYLSANRAQAIRNALGREISLPDSLVSLTIAGSDWQGLLSMVMADEAVPYRDDVVDLLTDMIAEGNADNEVEQSSRLARLRRLHGGEPYSYMRKNMFPALRASRIVLHYPQIARAQGDIDYLTQINLIEQPTVEQPEPLMLLVPTANPCKPFYMGLKTNLLYDAAALPSIGAEFYLGKNWSIVGNWTYGWWDTDSRHRYWRAYGGDIAIRRWFGRRADEKPLTGHHLGIYAGAITYDFEFGGVGHMGGLPGRSLWDRCNFMGGIEYGYSLPIARRLNLDFTIGIGYLGGKVIKYEPDGKFYRWESTKQFNWFGPTKLEVSLVWLIGCDNFNRQHHAQRKGAAL